MPEPRKRRMIEEEEEEEEYVAKRTTSNGTKSVNEKVSLKNTPFVDLDPLPPKWRHHQSL